MANKQGTAVEEIGSSGVSHPRGCHVGYNCEKRSLQPRFYTESHGYTKRDGEKGGLTPDRIMLYYGHQRTNPWNQARTKTPEIRFLAVSGKLRKVAKKRPFLKDEYSSRTIAGLPFGSTLGNSVTPVLLYVGVGGGY